LKLSREDQSKRKWIDGCIKVIMKSVPTLQSPNHCVKHGEEEAIMIIEGIWQNRLAMFEQHSNINVRDEMSRQSLRFFD
jgi:hypothetical protein